LCFRIPVAEVLPSEIILYALTTVLFTIPWLVLWFRNRLTILRMIVLLFSYDIVLTIEAAFVGDIFVIAILHVVTIPSLFVLIYSDIIKQNETQFKCFICERKIEPEEEHEMITRRVRGSFHSSLVHKACIEVAWKDRKAISKRSFRNGIPE
jgi:hypothetical protein